MKVRSCLLAFFFFAAGCARDAPSASKDAPPATSATATTASSVPPRPPLVHVVTEGDHLHLVEVRVGDTIELPADDAFDWSAHWQGEPILRAAAAPSPGRVRYDVIRTGGTHLVVDGDPKCLRLDGGCGTSKREWTIFLIVH